MVFFLPADRLIIAKDHASVQITIADVDDEGKITGTGTSFALCGQVRANGESDDSVNRLATKAGRKSNLSTFVRFPVQLLTGTNVLVLRNVWSYQK